METGHAARDRSVWPAGPSPLSPGRRRSELYAAGCRAAGVSSAGGTGRRGDPVRSQRPLGPAGALAGTLGIPTYTLVHGTLGPRCIGFYPLLADTVFCWGKIDREKFLAAGVAPERAVIAGCPA